MARDGSYGAPVHMDGSAPHSVLVCGKRGYGKSYTLGVLAEGLQRIPRVSTVIVDTMGIYWTMQHENEREQSLLTEWDLDPESYGLRVHRPTGDEDDALEQMRRLGGEMARGNGADVDVLDLSTYGYDVGLMSRLVAEFARTAYGHRHSLRREYERAALEGDFGAGAGGMPMLWMLVDEAHVFTPHGGETSASRVLIDGWLRQGRQLGLSLVLATQRPSALHPDVLSQSDIILCHRLTAQEDLDALNGVRPTYMHADLAESLERMGTKRGQALVIDDKSETVYVVRVRPRRSWHGGGEPNALD